MEMLPEKSVIPKGKNGHFRFLQSTTICFNNPWSGTEINVHYNVY